MMVAILIEKVVMRVLLIEDDSLLGESLKMGLNQYGVVVDWVSDGALGLEVACSGEPFDAVLLDLGLPGMDGLEILRRIRARKASLQLPVLILTARDQIDEKVTGLDAGAQDYIIKPFHLDELAARLRAAMRSVSGTKTIVSIGDVDYDSSRRMVTKAGNKVALSNREISIVSILMQNPGKAYSRQQIEDKLVGWGDEVMSNVIEVHIHNIRKKLGHDFVRHIRGVGYFVHHG